MFRTCSTLCAWQKWHQFLGDLSYCLLYWIKCARCDSAYAPQPPSTAIGGFFVPSPCQGWPNPGTHEVMATGVRDARAFVSAIVLRQPLYATHRPHTGSICEEPWGNSDCSSTPATVSAVQRNNKTLKRRPSMQKARLRGLCIVPVRPWRAFKFHIRIRGDLAIVSSTSDHEPFDEVLSSQHQKGAASLPCNNNAEATL